MRLFGPCISLSETPLLLFKWFLFLWCFMQMNMTKTNWNSTFQNFIQIIVNCWITACVSCFPLGFFWEAKYLHFQKKGLKLVFTSAFHSFIQKTATRWKFTADEEMEKGKNLFVCLFSPVCGFPLFLGCLCSKCMTLLFSAVFNFYAFQYLANKNFLFTAMLDFGIVCV